MSGRLWLQQGKWIKLPMCAACACACALQSTVDAADTVVDEAEEQAVDEQLQQLRQQIAAAKHHGKKCSFAAQWRLQRT